MIKKNVLLIASAGGHMYQLKKLYEELDCNQNYCWISTKFEFSSSVIKNENIYFVEGPTNRNLMVLLKNMIFAIKIMIKEKPDLLISTGAGIAVPFFIIGKIFGKKMVFIESFSRITSPSLTARILYYITNDFFVQWPALNEVFPRAIYKGKLL